MSINCSGKSITSINEDNIFTSHNTNKKSEKKINLKETNKDSDYYQKIIQMMKN